MDKRVVEFAFSKVSIEEKINSNGNKLILQKIAKDLLPSNYEYGRKQGFIFNINKLMGRYDVIDFMINELDVLKFCNKNYFEYLLRKNKTSSGYGEKLYGLFNFAFWIKKNKIIGIT